jgi:hypothetical protein
MRCRSRLREWYTDWREGQPIFMPTLSATNAWALPDVSTDSAELSDLLDDITIGMPSDFSPEERNALDLDELASTERRLREAEAQDLLREIRKTVKTLGAVEHAKHVHARGQAQNTRANSQIRTLIDQRTLLIGQYNACREAMISVHPTQSGTEVESFPPLTTADTFRKPPQQRRAVGDSRRFDAPLWTGTASSLTHSLAFVGPQDLSTEEPGAARTDVTRRQSRRLRSAVMDYQLTVYQPKRADARQRLCILNLMPTLQGISTRSCPQSKPFMRPNATRGGFGTAPTPPAHPIQMTRTVRPFHTPARLCSHQQTVLDRVQWFRAESEMYRWLEQVEIKHYEFVRLIRSYDKMADCWNMVGAGCEVDGARPLPETLLAYARRQGAVYDALKREAMSLFVASGEPDLVAGVDTSIPLGSVEMIERIARFRDKSLRWLRDRVSVRSGSSSLAPSLTAYFNQGLNGSLSEGTE